MKYIFIFFLIVCNMMVLYNIYNNYEKFQSNSRYQNIALDPSLHTLSTSNKFNPKDLTTGDGEGPGVYEDDSNKFNPNDLTTGDGEGSGFLTTKAPSNSNSNQEVYRMYGNVPFQSCEAAKEIIGKCGTKTEVDSANAAYDKCMDSKDWSECLELENKMSESNKRYWLSSLCPVTCGISDAEWDKMGRFKSKEDTVPVKGDWSTKIDFANYLVNYRFPLKSNGNIDCKKTHEFYGCPDYYYGSNFDSTDKEYQFQKKYVSSCHKALIATGIVCPR